MNKFHQLPFPVTHFHLPEKFTYPFHYTPHPLCVAAAAEVQKYLQNKDEWKSDLEQGKMFGVLIVQTQTGETGYLAAFSGILAGKIYMIISSLPFTTFNNRTVSSGSKKSRYLLSTLASKRLRRIKTIWQPRHYWQKQSTRQKKQSIQPKKS